MFIKELIKKYSIFCIAGLLQTACSETEETFSEQPVEALYNQGMDYLEKGSYTKSAQAFVEVERQHPYSALAPKSLLMAAYAYYQARKYDDAIENYRVFIQLHPGHEHVAYAYYMIGICSYEQIPLVQRDQKTTEEALQAFEEVVQRFSGSPYGKDARLKIDLIRDHLAGKEMDVGRYYIRKQAYLAALNRFKNVVEGYQTTSQAPEALHRIVECYLALGIMDEARRTASVLGHNYPGSTWYQDTYTLMGTAMPEALASNPKPGIGAKGAEKPAGIIGERSALAKFPESLQKVKISGKSE
jgi:outer membrane protein assembly factor BamD